MKKHLLTGKLVFFFLLACSTLFAQPYINPSSGLGQYGYVEKDASATNFLLNSGSHSNIYQLFARTYISSSILTYGTAVNVCGGTQNVSQTTNNYNFGTLSAGNTIYSSVHADYCGGGNSYSGNPNSTGFNERSFFVVDVAPTTNTVVSSACYTSANANVVMSFTIANGNTASQVLSRLWITNDGTAAEGTDIKNDAFVLYYEPATGSETFNGNESSEVLYGDYDSNPTNNNTYGNNNLNISIPQNTTGGLRCYVVLRGTATYLNASAKTKTTRIGIIADGISITPNRDGSYSRVRMDLTRSSSSFITINDAVTPTFTQVAPICSGATLAALPTISNNGFSGSWSPALSNTNTGTYTFTPAAGQCATTTTMTITVNQNVTYYRDADNDGYGDAAVTSVSCTGTPAGYVTNNTDCNDADGSMHARYSFYSNADNDNYGDGDLVLVCAVDANTAPAGYSRFTGDCDPSNGNLWQSGTLFIDLDGDGYTNGFEEVCFGGTYPAGYTNTSLGSDCDDTNNAIHATFSFYTDADNDGFGAGSLISVCAVDANTPPAGYSLNNTDCNDADATKHQTYSFYLDSDGDGHGVGSLLNNICAANATTAPAGYSLNNTDCDDTQATVYLGAPEILYDGLDNNCNGQLDEGFQLKTQLLAGSCGTTLASIGSLVQIKTMNQPITGYRIKVTNGTQVQYITRTVPHFTMNMLASREYATTYTVEIELERNGTWLGYYGDPCLVSTPAILDEGGATAVSPSQCGIMLPKITTLVSTTSLPGVTGYRFRVTDITENGSGLVQVIDRNLQWFSLQMLDHYNYNATYRVEVAVKTTGDYSNYGSPCEVSSPLVPMTKCDYTATSGTDLITAQSSNGVTQYRFQITKMPEGSVTTIDRSTHSFFFNQIPNYVRGGRYLVKVATLTKGLWSVYSDACTIYAPGSVTKGETTAITTVDNGLFNAVASPNPFASDFAINVTTAGTADVELRVYDMIGKLVENRSIKVSDLENVKVGAQYPSGVYNLVVTQGENVKTLRVIKR